MSIFLLNYKNYIIFKKKGKNSPSLILSAHNNLIASNPITLFLFLSEPQLRFFPLESPFYHQIISISVNSKAKYFYNYAAYTLDFHSKPGLPNSVKGSNMSINLGDRQSYSKI